MFFLSGRLYACRDLKVPNDPNDFKVFKDFKDFKFYYLYDCVV